MSKVENWSRIRRLGFLPPNVTDYSFTPSNSLIWLHFSLSVTICFAHGNTVTTNKGARKSAVSSQEKDGMNVRYHCSDYKEGPSRPSCKL